MLGNPDRPEKKQVEDLRKSRKISSDRIKALDDQQKEQIKKLRDKLSTIEKRISVLTKHDHRASFDSELALVLRGDYSLSGWVLNPFFIGFKDKKLSRENIMLVSRLDGPTGKKNNQRNKSRPEQMQRVSRL